MVLAQDMAQAGQAADVLAVRRYRKDIAKYQQEKIQYEKDLGEYDKNIKQEKIDNEKRIAAEKLAAEKAAKAQAEYEAANPWVGMARTIKARVRSGQISAGDFLQGGIVQKAMTSYYRSNPVRYSGNRFSKSKQARAQTARAYSAIGVSSLNISAAEPALRKIRERLSIGRRHNVGYGKGFNRARGYATHLLYGGSPAAWRDRIAAEDRNRAISQRQSAGLRAAGNKQIQAAQKVELARLAGGVSPSISTSSKVQRNVSAAAISTVALKAQDFPKNFQYMPKAEQQKVTASMGVTGTGTKDDPFVSQQPNVRLVSKYLKPEFTTTTPVKPDRPQQTKPDKPQQTQLQQRKSGIFTQQEQAEKAKAAFAETKKSQSTPQRYTPWAVKDKSFYTKEAATRYSINNPAVAMAISGTQLLMKPEEKQDESYIGYSPTGKPYQGAPSLKDLSYVGYSPTGEPYQGAVQPKGYVVNFGGKDRIFLSLASAERFVERVSKPITSTSSTPTGFLGELESSLRYSEKIDSGQVPKPSDAAGLVQYYSSLGLKPIADIGYAGKNLVTGEEEPITASLPSVVFEQGFDIVTKMWEQKSLTPSGVENISEKYIMEDPVRSIVQLPAEAALWITGGKAIGLGVKAAGKVASKFGITNPVARISGSVEGETIYRGITIKQKPIIGIQQGKIVIGQPKPVVPQLSKATLESRDTGELAFGYGAERALFSTEKGLEKQVKVGLINPLSKERTLADLEMEDAARAVRSKEFEGNIGADRFKSVSNKQGDYILKKIEDFSITKKIEPPHGSLAINVGIEPILKAESGNILRMGDADIVLKTLTPKQIKTISKLTKEEKAQGITAETKIQAYKKEKTIELVKIVEKDFPTELGEGIKVSVPKGFSNIKLVLTKADGTKHEPFEGVLRESQAMRKGSGQPSFIAGYKIPYDKTLKARDYNIKTQSLEYQALTQSKTILAYQKYSPTARTTSDTPARAKIYPPKGREDKDIARRYWEQRQIELNQIRAGKPLAAQRTELSAKRFKKLYPEVDFTSVGEERVAIKFTSQITESAPTPKVLVAPTIGGRGVIESSRTKIEPRNNISSRTQIKPREQSVSIKPKSITQQESFISKRIESSRSRSIFDEDESIGLYAASRINSVGSSKSKSVSSKASSFLKSFTSAKPISSKPIIPVSGKPSVISSPPSKPPSRLPSRPPSIRGKPSLRSSFRSSSTGAISITAARSPKKTVVPIVLALKSTEMKRKKDEKGQKDFLGNTRTDKFVGLINRKEILVGDKLTQKQVKLDKRLVLNPKPPKSRKQTRKRDTDVPVTKGFKF